jgi:hypothetical protein
VKAASTALAAHLDQEVTALATCWRLTRTDGLLLGFTDHDRDLVIEGLTYRAASAYSRTAIASRAGLAVDNLDLEGLLDSDAISEEELRAGRFDRAAIEIFLVNWQALGQGVVRLRRGTLGEVRLQGGLYRAELRGMAQALAAPAVEVYTPDGQCRGQELPYRDADGARPPPAASTAMTCGPTSAPPPSTSAPTICRRGPTPKAGSTSSRAPATPIPSTRSIPTAAR